MKWFLRSSLLPSIAVVYVCFAAMQATGGALHTYFVLLALPWGLSRVWRRTEVPEGGEDSAERALRLATRAGFWGAALWIAARTGSTGRAGFEAAANIGAGTTAVAALVALARIGSLGGMVSPHPGTRALDGASFAGLAWGIAVALPTARALFPARYVRLDPLTIDYATTSASLASLMVLLVAAARLRHLRRFELGIGDRANGALVLSLAAFAFVVPAALLAVAAPDRLLPLGVLLASGACIWTARTSDPAFVARALRATLAVAMLGAPTVLVAGLLARELPEHAGGIVLMASAAAVGVGLWARSVARPLGPEQSRWLDAIRGATLAALVPEPEAAIRAALEALGKGMSHAGASPKVFRSDPEQILAVDIAGYLHVEAGVAPARLYELALGEPERTLRTEALRAVEVRRPDIRPLLSWMEDHQAFCLTLVLAEEGPLGFIMIPRGTRKSPLTLEEARGLRVLGDRLSAVLAMSSALARSQERELGLRTTVDLEQREVERLTAMVTLYGDRHALGAERLARTVRRTAYSPRARLTLDAAERMGKSASRIALVAPPGTQALSWCAVLHLASNRRGGPLVVVEGANGAEHELATWLDPARSPLALADGGTLVVLDAPALPIDVQEQLAIDLAQRAARAQSSVISPPGLLLVLHAQPEELVGQGRLSRVLERALSAEVLELPPLHARSEDLRALILDELARVGMRLRGEPLGIEPAALRALAEHSWPGNELELEHVLVRAARFASSSAVSRGDLSRAGFDIEVIPSPSDTPIPAPAERRRRAR